MERYLHFTVEWKIYKVLCVIWVYCCLKRKRWNGKAKSRIDTVLERIPAGKEAKSIISSTLPLQCWVLMLFVPWNRWALVKLIFIRLYTRCFQCESKILEIKPRAPEPEVNVGFEVLKAGGAKTATTAQAPPSR